jgi:hypothetical protein
MVVHLVPAPRRIHPQKFPAVHQCRRDTAALMNGTPARYKASTCHVLNYFVKFNA